ncbi:glutamate 5-kinase [Priestia koreensis]|uniref:glutamate 5-kinase n=1 Tax=Priestia koreensis TaxID=284581 RepID=UPI003D05FB88
MAPDTMRKRVVIKIGSSSLTSMHGEISRKKLERLVDEVVHLKDDGHEVLLVSSGAVAAGYRKLGCLERPSSLPEKQAAASIGQGLLVEAYSELFLSHGYVASQILITRDDFSDEKRYNNVRNTINVLLERGIVPIINENDTVTIDRLKFGDNDTLSAKVAGLVNANQLVILSDIDGLYDDNPHTNPHAKLLENVEEITPEIEAGAGDSASAVGTGGMRSKLDAFKITMASGIPAFLGKAGITNIIYDSIHSTAKGTYFTPTDDSANLDQKKQWIAFNSGPEGEIVVSNFAKDGMIEHSECLHSNGVERVMGYFQRGSVVRLLDVDEQEIGLGIVNYSSEEIKASNSGEELQRIIEKDGFVCHLEIAIPVGV